MDAGWLFKATIDQDGKNPVDRDFFLRADFQHIHAVVYMPLHFGEPILLVKECAALHNPMARQKGEAIALGLGSKFEVDIGDSEFTVGPLK